MRPEQAAAGNISRFYFHNSHDPKKSRDIDHMTAIIRRANAEHYGPLLRDALGGSLQGNTRIRLERELAALEGEG